MEYLINHSLTARFLRSEL